MKTSHCIGLILTLSVSQTTLAVPIIWTGGGGNNSWHTAANWNLNRVPAVGDDVVIPDMTPNVNVTFSSGSSTINSLTSSEAFTLSAGILIIDMASSFNNAVSFSGGVLGGSGDVTVNGVISWTFATLAGTGALNANGGITISGDTFAKTLAQRTLNNAGLATYTGTGQLALNQSAVWNNLPGSTFVIQNTAPIGFTAAPAGTFNNQGTLRKTSPGTSNISIALNNDGIIEVQTGTLTASGGGTSNGDFDVAPSSTITLNGTHAINVGMSLSGAGTLSVVGGTTTFTDAPSGSGNMTITGGIANFNGTGILNSLSLIGGLLGGTGTLTALGPMTWTFTNLGGTGVLNANGGITISGDTFTRALSQRTLNNAGLATFSGTGQLALNQGALWNNLPGSTFEIQNAAAINFSVGPAGTFANQGTLRKTSAGTSTISINVSNPGAIDVDTGILNITAALANFSGTMLSGGTYDISGILRFTGANIVTNTASMILDGPTSAIQNTGGVDALANFATNAAAGSFQIKNGRNFSRTGSFSNAGQVLIGPGASTLNATGNYVQTAGGTTLNGGTLDPTSLIDIQGGELKGNGSILGNVTNAGSCKVGLSPGSISITGDYTQTASGTFEAEIGGLTPGVGGFDQLAVSGTVILGGTLSVALFGGFEPEVSNLFDIITAATRSGTFATHNLPLPFNENCKGIPEYGASYVRVNTFAQVMIADQPNSQAICVGDPVTLGVSVNGSGPFTYQWRKDGEDLRGETSNFYTDVDVQPGDIGDYDVIVTNICGFENSTVATLAVNVAPSISQDPQPVTRCEGEEVILCVVASGMPAPSYQWKKDGVDIDGEHEDCFNLPSVTVDDAGVYTVVVSNACDSPESTPATLTVNTAPVFLLQPVAQSSCVGGSVSFAVNASGSPAPIYQWRLNDVPLSNGGNIIGADSATLVIDSVGLTDAGNYDCVVSNVCGSPNSDDASLVVFASGSGDVNGDTMVDGADVQGFIDELLTCGPVSATYCSADMDSNGTVDLDDASLLINVLIAF